MLAEIIESKRAEVAARKRKINLPTLWRGVQASDRSLADALSAPETSYIMECKKASPSRGTIRPDFDVAAIARAYDPIASAISVLTDARFFQGSLEYLSLARAQTSAPILCKDFIIDPYQVLEARKHGADAVLLMLSVLTDAEWRDCYGLAKELGMDCLTEVHDKAELDRAIILGAPIIGINNRDLTTLDVSLDTTRELAPLVPSDRIIVSESGIRTHQDTLDLRDHVDAFLVGSSLMQELDLRRAARALVYGRVKICGLTKPDDALTAWKLGATHGGVIFAPESPRALSPDRALELTRAAPWLEWVGVFVNAPTRTIIELVDELRLSAVQLHGEEPPEQIIELRELLPSACELWIAARVGTASIESAPARSTTRRLFDTHAPDKRGGTGRPFDWDKLDGVTDLSSSILSGGLSPSNIDRASRRGCFMLDVNSGVELAPGFKSADKLDKLFTTLRGTRRKVSRETSSPPKETKR